MGNSGVNLVVAIFLLVLGVLLFFDVLDILFRILGVICIVAGVIVGAMALFGRKNRY